MRRQSRALALGQIKPARDPAPRLVLSWHIPPAGTSKICGGDVGEATAVDISTYSAQSKVL